MQLKKPKVVLLGNSSVGKSSLAMRIKHNHFIHDLSSTIGCEFFACEHTAVDGTQYRLLIWDTAGQEMYRSFTPQFTRSAVVALVFYDLSDLTTMNSISGWISESEPDCDIIIVPTKLDLYPPDKEIPNVNVEGGGRKVHQAMPISSKDGVGIQDLLEQICTVVSRRRKMEIYEPSTNEVDLQDKDQTFPCC